MEEKKDMSFGERATILSKGYVKEILEMSRAGMDDDAVMIIGSAMMIAVLMKIIAHSEATGKTETPEEEAGDHA